jgi:hypothetical protein
MTREERILLSRIEKLEQDVRELKLKSNENGTTGNNKSVDKPAGKGTGVKK